MPVAPIASVSANARRSQSAWKTGSSASGSTGPEAVLPAHVVDAVHAAASAGVRASPVPIIASRVTSSASSSSPQPSVPSGRIGMTR